MKYKNCIAFGREHISRLCVALHSIEEENIKPVVAHFNKKLLTIIKK